MPDNWLFNGYFAFVLFGPKGLPAKTFSCLMEKDDDKVEKKGRSELRKAEAEAKSKERQAAAGRGVSVKDSFAFATLEHSQMRDEARNVRELLLIANQDEGNALKHLEMVENMLQRAIDRDDDDRIQSLSDRQETIFMELESITARKRKLREISDNLLLNEKRAAIPAVMLKADEDTSTITASTPATKAPRVDNATPSSTSSNKNNGDEEGDD